MNKNENCHVDETKAPNSVCIKSSRCFVGCSAEQERSVSRVLLVLLSAALPLVSPAYQTDT